MRKRAGLARALVLDPEIILFDEPDSGLDPVRTAYLNQLIVDLNAQIDATFLIVTHDINTARTVPDNIGLLYHRHLAMFGPREMLLSSEEPVVRQFLNAQRDRADRDVRGEGRRRAGRRVRPGAAAAAADPEQLHHQRRHLRRHQREAGRLVPRQRRDARRPARSATTRDRVAWPSTSGLVTRLRPAVRCGRAGNLFALALDVLRALPRRPFQAQGVHPAGLVHRQRHHPADRAGVDPVRRGHRAAARHADPPARRAVATPARRRVLAIVREASPIVTALLIAGAGGSAICADLGSRKIREEIDAHGGAGHQPDPAPGRPAGAGRDAGRGAAQRAGLGGRRRSAATSSTSCCRAARRAPTSRRSPRSPSWPTSGSARSRRWSSALIAAIVASYKGLTAGGGPKGVGDAVNQSVVITFMLLFVVNFVAHGRVLPGRPAEARVTAMTSIATARRRHRCASAGRGPGRPRRPAAFYVRSLAWTPRTIRRYKKEVMRLLAEVSLGTGALVGHRRHRRRDHVPDVLHRHRGRPAGLQRAEPARHRRVHRLHLRLLQHPRDRAAGRRRSRSSATVGCGFTAQLGAMRISEEIDALEVMGVPSAAVPGHHPDDRRLHRGHPAVRHRPAVRRTSPPGSSPPMYFGQSTGTYDHYFHLFLPPATSCGRSSRCSSSPS